MKGKKEINKNKKEITGKKEGKWEGKRMEARQGENVIQCDGKRDPGLAEIPSHSSRPIDLTHLGLILPISSHKTSLGPGDYTAGRDCPYSL